MLRDLHQTIEGESSRVDQLQRTAAVHRIAVVASWVAFNAVCQGTGAIQAKRALLSIFEAGIFPTLPVHDEINSANINNEKQAGQMKEIMEHSLPLMLPARADLDVGLTWQ